MGNVIGVNLNVPSLAGFGTPSDVSAMEGTKTIQVTNSAGVTEGLILQLSQDGGVSWVNFDQFSFNERHCVYAPAIQMRVHRTKVGATLPVVSVSASPNPIVNISLPSASSSPWQGAATDVSSIGDTKLVTLTGAGAGEKIAIQVSDDGGVTWLTVATMVAGDVPKQIVCDAALLMRTVRTAQGVGLPKVFVTGNAPVLSSIISKSNTRQFIYVRPGGNDETGNGSLASPFATIRKAISTIPIIIEGTRFFIDATGVTDSYTGSFAIPPFQSGDDSDFNEGVFSPTPASPLLFKEATINVFATPTTLDTLVLADVTAQITDSVTFLLRSTSVTPGGGLVTNRASIAGLSAVDSLKNKFLIGSGPGEVAVITGNSAGPNIVLQTTMGGPFTLPVKVVDLNGEMKEISGKPAIVARDIGASIQFGGIRFTGGSGPGTGTVFGNSAAVEQRDLVEGDFTACVFNGGFENFATRNNFGNMIASIVTGGSGGGGPGFYRGVGVAPFMFNSFFDAIKWNDIVSVTVEPIFFCVAQGCSPLGQDSFAAGLIPGGTRMTDGLMMGNIEFTHILNGTGNGVQQAGAPMSMRRNVIDNCLGNAIAALGVGGRLFLDRIHGTGNGGVGVSVDDGAHVRLRLGAGPTDVTGTGGNMKVGGRMARSWADLASGASGAPINNEFDVPGFPLQLTPIPDPETPGQTTGARLWATV